MKVGLSTYSLRQAIQKGEMDVLRCIEWIAANGGEHVEIVPDGFSLSETPELIGRILAKVKETNLAISSYTISADFVQPDRAALQKEIERIRKEVDVARQLGVQCMRHDAAWRPIPECSVAQFEKDLPSIADACRSVADYAQKYGITTSVENHGYFVQKSDRVQRLVNLVGRDNFRTTLDIGNFLCVDEDPVAAVINNVSFASHVHFKDFYVRPSTADPGEGFFKTISGKFMRGAIVGQGDVDIRSVTRIVKSSGYDGYVSIEFEGMEDCRLGSRIGMANLRRFWNECA